VSVGKKNIAKKKTRKEEKIGLSDPASLPKKKQGAKFIKVVTTK